MGPGKEGGCMARPRRYPDDLKAWGVRMVRDIDERGAVRRVAELLDISAETWRA